MRAKMVVEQTNRSPTRCSYYEARLTGVPVRRGEEYEGYDGPVGAADVRGVDGHSGFEVVGGTPLKGVSEVRHSEPRRSEGEESTVSEGWPVRRFFGLRLEHDRPLRPDSTSQPTFAVRYTLARRARAVTCSKGTAVDIGSERPRAPAIRADHRLPLSVPTPRRGVSKGATPGERGVGAPTPNSRRRATPRGTRPPRCRRGAGLSRLRAPAAPRRRPRPACRRARRRAAAPAATPRPRT